MATPTAPAVHPAFRAHFTAEIYRDQGNDLAPFGSDEGADILAEWEPRRGQLGPTATVRDILAPDVDDVDEFIGSIPDDQPDLDSIVIGAGFTLLRLTGQIDPEGREWTTQALQRTLRCYTNPEAQQMLADLASFSSPPG